ncbi:hypothetical protein [Uliginosibacterium sediminicola]|uniref:Uncharacterized protein n=1 Tax=Uliginosibacterium sediminicola TaxID=2024550 RepID=A0ABU9Z0N5_9RHOO
MQFMALVGSGDWTINLTQPDEPASLDETAEPFQDDQESEEA